MAAQKYGFGQDKFTAMLSLHIVLLASVINVSPQEMYQFTNKFIVIRSKMNGDMKIHKLLCRYK